MSTTTKDHRSPVDELMEAVPYSDIGNASELAAETPLTREAVIHLRAAGREVSRAYGKVQALLATVERALAEPSGGPTTLSEEERMDLAMLLREARQTADHGMQRPVFERGRGERPHGGVAGTEDGGGTLHLPLTETEIETILAVAHAVALASDGELGDNTRFDRTPKSLRPVWGALSDRMERLAANIRDAADMSMEKELHVGSDAVSSIKGDLLVGGES